MLDTDTLDAATLDAATAQPQLCLIQALCMHMHVLVTALTHTFVLTVSIAGEYY